MTKGTGKFGTALLASIALAFSSPVLAEETYYAPHGARGDFGKDLRCQPGYYVVGFEGGTGQIMDRIALRCARIKSDGVANASEIVTDSYGGGGGGPNSKSCMVGQTVALARVRLNLARKQVEWIDFGCGTPESTTYSMFDRYGGLGDHVTWHGLESDEGRERNFICKPGEAMTGLTIRYGEHVNALGLICDKVVRMAPPPPPPAPKQYKTTGKPKAAATSTLVTAFAGYWMTTSSLGEKYALVLQPTGSPIGPGGMAMPMPVTGQILDPETKKVIGSLSGVVQPNTRQLTFGYGIEGLGGGNGVLNLAIDGQSIQGQVGQSGKGTGVWNGVRGK